ncbi:MAG: hypothetical protein ANABAC_2670 [Anaerolineae bacterium]|nr:MAG: hypothetical protein ANABAC_2670 [Anaerolineae bacterium]
MKKNSLRFFSALLLLSLLFMGQSTTLVFATHHWFDLLSSSVSSQAWQYTGPDSGIIYAVAIDPNDPSILYASSDDGVLFKSTDGGATWDDIVFFQYQVSLTALAIDPQASTTIYVGNT